MRNNGGGSHPIQTTTRPTAKSEQRGRTNNKTRTKQNKKGPSRNTTIRQKTKRRRGHRMGGKQNPRDKQDLDHYKTNRQTQVITIIIVLLKLPNVLDHKRSQLELEYAEHKVRNKLHFGNRTQHKRTDKDHLIKHNIVLQRKRNYTTQSAQILRHNA